MSKPPDWTVKCSSSGSSTSAHQLVLRSLSCRSPSAVHTYTSAGRCGSEAVNATVVPDTLYEATLRLPETSGVTLPSRHLHFDHAHRAPVLNPYNEGGAVCPPNGRRRFGDLQMAVEAHGQTMGQAASCRDQPQTTVAG